MTSWAGFAAYQPRALSCARQRVVVVLDPDAMTRVVSPRTGFGDSAKDLGCPDTQHPSPCRAIRKGPVRAKERLTRGQTFLVELRGLEPLTPCMPCRCATSCATAPHDCSCGAPGGGDRVSLSGTPRDSPNRSTHRDWSRRSTPRSASHRRIRPPRPNGSCAAPRWTARPATGPARQARRRRRERRHRAWR
jgi:hypothetical protein